MEKAKSIYLNLDTVTTKVNVIIALTKTDLSIVPQVRHHAPKLVIDVLHKLLDSIYPLHFELLCLVSLVDQAQEVLQPSYTQVLFVCVCS